MTVYEEDYSGVVTRAEPEAIPWLLRRAVRRYGRAIRSAVVDAGHPEIPQPGLWALHALASAERSAGELTEVMQISKQAVSQLVETLVSSGYLERHPDESDRRRVNLRITAAGREVVEVIDSAVAEIDAELERRSGAERVAVLREVLADVAALSPPS